MRHQPACQAAVRSPVTGLFVLAVFAAAPLLAAAAPPDPRPGVGHPGFLSPHVNPLAVVNGHLFVANTPADTLDVIEIASRSVIRRIPVGIQPVSVVARPDGREVWVANHVSDSVSVIDTAPESLTRFHVIATIQDLDPLTLATRFDEPAGIAFADNSKAYVALSSENRVAVIDVAQRSVVKSLLIPAQDPRAIQVRKGKLYVAPFESHNRTQLSGGRGEPDGDLVTFDAWEHSIRHNNVLSLGSIVDIVKHPDVPDRDLFVFDTATDGLIETVEGLGTLLYGLAVDGSGRVFLAQTDARNDANGRAGTKHQGLTELENRPFLNRITSVLPGSGEPPRFYDLEPLPPEQPADGTALATPFGLRVSDDGQTIVATAAGSGMLFTLDVASGAVLGRVTVGFWPDGVVLECDSSGAPVRAWVLAAFSNEVTLVDLTDREHPAAVATIPLADPTPEPLRLGKIAFHTAATSTTKTFSCASCHPDGHTDHLLWVLDTPVVSGGNQIMPRSTMPCRGLRDTAPFHWDGIPGDPYGGINSASVHRGVAANSDAADPSSPVRHLIDGGLASTMRLAGDEGINDEGKPGTLSAAERDAMAAFLLDIPYPPAQRRRGRQFHRNVHRPPRRPRLAAAAGDLDGGGDSGPGRASGVSAAEIPGKADDNAWEACRSRRLSARRWPPRRGARARRWRDGCRGAGRRACRWHASPPGAQSRRTCEQRLFVLRQRGSRTRRRYEGEVASRDSRATEVGSASGHLDRQGDRRQDRSHDLRLEDTQSRSRGREHRRRQSLDVAAGGQRRRRHGLPGWGGFPWGDFPRGLDRRRR